MRDLHPFSGLGNALRLLRSKHRLWKEVKTWRAAQENRGCQISARINFTGRPQGYSTIALGRGAALEADVTLWISDDAGSRPELMIGNDVFIGRSTYIGVYVPVSIGDNTIIGAFGYIISANHVFSSRAKPIRHQGFTGEPIRISDDVWLGAHVVVLPGVEIGRGSIVAAASVVTRNIPEYQVWGGVPARFIKMRPD